jgi:hypothetical protein
MVLIPYPSIGMGKTKVRLIFNSPFMKDRTFTMNSKPKERRSFTQRSTVSLQSLIKATTSISESASAILDFTEALEHVDFAEEESLFLQPILKEVINAVNASTGDMMMRGMHRMMRLQSVLKRISTRLSEPNLLIDLMDETSKPKYWKVVCLRDHVKMVMRQQKDSEE